MTTVFLKRSLGLALAVIGSSAAAALVSVDFGANATAGDPVASPTFSGAEAAATAANARFGAANVWNGIALPEYLQNAVTNPTFNNLRDSTGAATGIGLSLTGSVKGFSGFNNPSTDTLRKDYLFFNSGNNTARTLSFSITGLVAGAAYDFFVYGSTEDRSFTMQVAGTSGTVSGSNGARFFDDLIADANGMISGSLIPPPDTVFQLSDGDVLTIQEEVNWSGFQIVDNVQVNQPPVSGTPEPASLALLGLGLAGIGWTRRKR